MENKIIGGFVGLTSGDQIKKYNITKSLWWNNRINIENGSVSTFMKKMMV